MPGTFPAGFGLGRHGSIVTSVSVKLVVIAGARPNFMKVAPLWTALSADPLFVLKLVHTGQHYDYAMSGRFFEELGLPPPDHHLEAGSGSHAQQTGEILKRLEPILISEQPQAVVVVGDVNSTLAGALVAKKLGIEVVHIEAGLRSFDRTMPEEINRLVTDSISDLFLVTEESGRFNLLREGAAPERIHMVGNLMIDSLHRHLERALQSNVRQQFGLDQSRFGLVTLHRPANVDHESQLAEILGALEQIAREVPLYWPVHPRTRAKMAGLVSSENIHLLEPLGYLDFLSLEAQSAVVLTDSGGIQEETTVLGVPCLTIRDNTERPVTIECGTNRLAGTTRSSILEAWRQLSSEPKKALRIPPLWDGKAGERCHAALSGHFLSQASSGRP
jgi:UDP-N-acetylglucosamine 2-epimerase (non-hydrolysing)